MTMTPTSTDAVSNSSPATTRATTNVIEPSSAAPISDEFGVVSSLFGVDINIKEFFVVDDEEDKAVDAVEEDDSDVEAGVVGTAIDGVVMSVGLTVVVGICETKQNDVSEVSKRQCLTVGGRLVSRITSPASTTQSLELA